MNFLKWELDHVTPLLKTPACSLKAPKIESSASRLCSHLPLAPISCHLPRYNLLPSFLALCHIIYFCSCSLLSLESLSHPPWPELKTVYPEWIWFLPRGLESLTVTVSNRVMCACIPSLAHIKADALIVEEGTGRSLRLKSWSFPRSFMGIFAVFLG